MELSLRDLRYFEVLAEMQHLGRAAERLARSQPALTNASTGWRRPLAARFSSALAEASA